MSKDDGYQLLARDPRLLQAMQAEDEVSLIDLWLVLARRKRLIFAILLGSLLLGLGYYFTHPKSYAYATAVEIGTTLVKEGNGYATALIDPPQTVLAKLNESYIPWVRHRYFQEHPEDKALYLLEASIPKDSQLIVIKGEGPATDEAIYLTQMHQVLKRLLEDHQRQTVVVRSGIEAQLARAREKLAELRDPSTLAVQRKNLEKEINALKIKLDELRDPRIMRLAVQKIETDLAQKKKALLNLKNQEHLFRAQYRRLDQVDELLKKQIAELQAQIALADKQRPAAVTQVSDAGVAMAMLMIDNEIQKNRNRLAALEERLYISQKNEREKLLNRIEDNQREQAVQAKVIARLEGELEKLKFDNERQQARLLPKIALLEEKLTKLLADHKRRIRLQQQQIHELEVRLANMKETRALIDPVRSLEPLGPSGKTLLALAGILGLFLGIFAAFTAEFLAKVRQRVQGKEQAA